MFCHGAFVVRFAIRLVTCQEERMHFSNKTAAVICSGKVGKVSSEGRRGLKTRVLREHLNARRGSTLRMSVQGTWNIMADVWKAITTQEKGVKKGRRNKQRVSLRRSDKNPKSKFNSKSNAQQFRNWNALRCKSIRCSYFYIDNVCKFKIENVTYEVI